ncbi:unnamed protein product, partial [Pocillopora meandrina]
MPGSGPDDLHEEPDIPNNPPTDPPTSQGIDEVFSLSSRHIFNQKQFVFNAELEELVGKIKEANAQKDHKKVAHLTDQAKALLHKRQKLIKLADSSEAGWDAVQEYESQDIASDDEDDKKIRNAANRKRKQKERERQQQSNKKRCTTPNLGTQDHHLFRGICIAIVFTLYSSCYSLRCFVIFSCYI